MQLAETIQKSKDLEQTLKKSSQPKNGSCSATPLIWQQNTKTRKSTCKKLICDFVDAWENKHMENLEQASQNTKKIRLIQVELQEKNKVINNYKHRHVRNRNKTKQGDINKMKITLDINIKKPIQARG